jgi:hypothetical protein
MEIIETILSRVDKTKVILTIFESEAKALYNHLQKYHRVTLPDYEKWKLNASFYGYKLNVV